MAGLSAISLIAVRLGPLCAAIVLVAGCAAGPSETAWEAGGALDPDQAPGGALQVAQQSDSGGTLFGVEGDADEDDDNDPLELPNRFMFAINQTLDIFIIKPIAATYRFLLPQLVRDSVRSVLRNLSTPVILANDVFQGEFERAETTLVRFAINTTGGVLGLYDLASDQGYVYHNEDFGQTLGSYGVGEGAYLVLPILGPSSIRDGVGFIVDIFLDPLTYVASAYDLEEEFLARPIVNGIDTRSRNIETLEDLERDSIDFYARIRSLWRQNRQHEIRNESSDVPAAAPGLSEFEYEIEPDDGQLGSAQ